MARSFFFFTLLLLLSTQIQARDSYFFGKFSRDNVVPVDTTEKSSTEDQSQDQDQNPTFIPDSNNGYGLYGHETETSTYNNKYDQKVNTETFSTPSLTETEEDSTYNPNKKTQSYQSYDENYPNKKTQSYEEKYPNKKTESYESYEEKYPNKKPESYESYEEKYRNKKPESYESYEEKDFNKKPESYENYNGYDNNKYENNNGNSGYYENNEKGLYHSNAYGTEVEDERAYKGYTSQNLEREGMSDTRFMEKGKYYYDVYNPRNHGHFYQKTRPNAKYNPAGFKDPYDSKWEKEQVQVPEEFQEEQVDRFNP